MAIRTVVVGYGGSGRAFHCYLVKLAAGLELYGVVSGDAEKRAKIVANEGCQAFATLDEALADPQVQLIVLATPNNTHAGLAIQAMNAGKHVVTDKVMCLSLADCDAMIAAAQRNNVFLSVFQNRRWDGDYLTIRQLMADGILGEVRWMEMAWHGYGAWGGWRGQAEMGGGKLYDLGAHLIDQLCLFFPQPIESVYCRMHHDFPQTNTESEALLVVTFQGGCTGVCDFSSLAAVSKPRFYVHGLNGTFCKHGLDPQEAAMKAGNIDAAVEDPATYGILKNREEERVVPTLAGRWRSYYENVADVLLHGAEPAVKLPELRRQITIIDAAWQSARTGQVVQIA